MQNPTLKTENATQIMEKLPTPDSIYEPDPLKSCFVGGIPVSFTSEHFEKILRKKLPDLEIEHVMLVKSKKNKYMNKGFGFVGLKTHEQQLEFLQRKIQIEKKVLDIRVAKKMKEQRKEEKKTVSKRVFMRGFSEEVTDDTLRHFLITFGQKIIRCYVIRDHSRNVSKGIGIVDFETQAGAEAFLQKKNIRVYGSDVELSHFSLNIKLKRGEIQEEDINSEERHGMKGNQSGGDATKDSDDVGDSSEEESPDRPVPMEGQNLITTTNRFIFSLEELNEDERDVKWVFLIPSRLKKLNEAPMNYQLTRVLMDW